VKRLAALLTVVASLAAPALAHAAPPIARPNPAVYPIQLDYESPLASPNGGSATLAALGQGAILAATRDRASLAFGARGDLGGFVPAPIGKLALSGGGRDMLVRGPREAQIPLFFQSAGGEISSFAFRGAIPNPSDPPDNGRQRIPGIGPPPPVPAPTGSNTVPPANQGFGGRPSGQGGGKRPGTTTTTSGGGGGGGTVTQPQSPATTTAAFTTTAETRTVTTTPVGGAGGGGGGGACSGGSCTAGSCGVAGIQIESTPPGCVITLSRAAPGDSVTEVMTITNTSDTSYVLSVKAEGANNNHLWQDLELGIWQVPGPPPASLPSLSSWLLGFSSLITLNSGDSVQYEIELYLPTTAGNADQGKTAVVAFRWRAQG
jgi:hypothetical protein